MVKFLITFINGAAKGTLMYDKASLFETSRILNKHQVPCKCWEKRCLVSVYSVCTLIFRVFENL